MLSVLTYIFKTFAEHVEQTKQMLFKSANVANLFFLIVNLL